MEKSFTLYHFLLDNNTETLEHDPVFGLFAEEVASEVVSPDNRIIDFLLQYDLSYGVIESSLIGSMGFYSN